MERRGKFWCFTSFNLENVPFSCFEDSIDYLGYGREVCPTTGREHFQGVVAFTTRRKFSTVRNALPGGHVEKVRGTMSENVQYCKKDGCYYEYGAVPNDVKTNDKFRDALRLAGIGELGRIRELYPALYLRYKATLESSACYTLANLDDSCGVWICGPPRSSKDFAIRALDSLFVKPLNKWWDGYKNEENVLISDVDPHHGVWLGNFLKIWADRYPFIAEIKGSSMKIRPKRIYCTSNFVLKDCFDSKICDAISARFLELNGSFENDDVNVVQRLESKPSIRYVDVLSEYDPHYAATVNRERMLKEINGPTNFDSETALASTSRDADVGSEALWSDMEDFVAPTQKKKQRKICKKKRYNTNL